MAAIVTSDGPVRTIVRPYVRTMSDGRVRMTRPVTSPATRMAVPVADSQLKLKTAASGAAVATTGGTRRTALSSPGIGSVGAETPLSTAFTCGRPHRNTITLSTTHGRYASAR